MALNILEQDREDDKENLQVCKLCLTQFAKYTCPRCNIQYCSLACYRDEKHARCSESFYEECFMAELQQRKGSSEEKQRMIDILKRLKEGSQDGRGEGGREGNEKSLEDRLAGLDLDRDSESVWRSLTKTEQKDFHRLLDSGKLGHLLETHTPWWEVYSPVRESQDKDGSETVGSRVPPVLSGLPPLQSLMKSTQPSPFIRYSVINVLYSYCYTVRLFNGEHTDLALQASQVMLDISSCLSSNASFSTAGEAVQNAVCCVQQNQDVFNSSDFSLSVMKDVSHVLRHPKSHDCHVTHALSDLHALLTKAHKLVKSSSKGATDPNVTSSKHQLWLAKKKIYLFIVWSLEHEDNLCPLAKLIDLEYETSKMSLTKDEGTKMGGQRQRRISSDCQPVTHKLIEELN